MDHSPINKTTLDLVDFLRRGGTVPPIHVQLRNGAFHIRDGRHRVTAYKLIGREWIEAKYGKVPAQAKVPKATNPTAHCCPQDQEVHW